MLTAGVVREARLYVFPILKLDALGFFFFSVDQNNSQKNFFSLNLDSLSLLKSYLSVLRRQVISVDELCHA